MIPSLLFVVCLMQRPIYFILFPDSAVELGMFYALSFILFVCAFAYLLFRDTAGSKSILFGFLLSASYFYALIIYMYHGGSNVIYELFKFILIGMPGVLLAIIWRDKYESIYYISPLIMLTSFFIIIIFFLQSKESLTTVGAGNYQESGYFILLIIILNYYLFLNAERCGYLHATLSLLLILPLLGTGARGPLFVLSIFILLYLPIRLILLVASIVSFLIYISLDSYGIMRILSIFIRFFENYNLDLLLNGRISVNSILFGWLDSFPLMGLGIGNLENFGAVPHGLFQQLIINFGYIFGLFFSLLVLYAFYTSVRSKMRLTSVLYIYSFCMLIFSGLIWTESIFLFSFITQLVRKS
ncbi:hypothetical protein XMG59_001585 [Marinobacterium sp. xm-g-59]|uniref:hypothetical protein n=1 Tax=Marinobacterium sp. xm-g-59 TaxID=2497748 RepID=UPI0015698ACE|nr:hypothetical protein [Marinobacterium sp. xm-g-59]NRP95481.1 hypothetical protein [Marinobacterium sp. xm-g-59]